MNYQDLIHARLAADATLIAALTGGIRLINTMPAKVNPTTLPAVYNGTKLKPFMVVRGRAGTPFGTLRDGTYRSMRQVVELYFYNDQSAGWATIRTAADRAYALLQGQPVTGAFDLTLSNEIDDQREPEMQDACMLRRDYEVIGRKI